MKTIIIFVIFILIVVFGAYWLFNRSSTELTNLPANGKITIAGQIVCLPHKDTTGPQTLECAYGLHGDNGNYYMLQSDGIPISNYQTGSHVRVIGYFVQGTDPTYATVGMINSASVENTQPQNTSTTTAATNEYSDGVITFTKPKDFGLAVTQQQLPNNSTIPPCDPEFEYCLYYLGDSYASTSLESAGVSIQKNSSSTSQMDCLNKHPDGYTALVPIASSSKSNYAMSVFFPLEDGAAGSFSTDEQYRLYTANTCYVLNARIGQVQGSNYPTGTRTALSTAQVASLRSKLEAIIAGIQLKDTSETISLPVAAAS